MLLLGGTLQPFDILVSSLFPSLPSSGITYFSCDHIAPAANIKTILLSRGCRGTRFDFSHNRKFDEDMLSELLVSMEHIVRVVPNGIVVFFTSYAYMEHVLHKWATMATYNELKSLKSIFIEPKDSKETSKMWSDYTQAASSSLGAVLFCVVGGKLSEGINFSDHLARSVVVVGLPYPDNRDPLLQEKLKFAERLKAGGGKAFYDNLCMKAVNQSVGRSIRHINDFASVLLVDARYSQERVHSLLPGWIRRDIESPPSFGEVVPKLRTFYQYHAVNRK